MFSSNSLSEFNYALNKHRLHPYCRIVWAYSHKLMRDKSKKCAHESMHKIVQKAFYLRRRWKKILFLLSLELTQIQQQINKENENIFIQIVTFELRGYKICWYSLKVFAVSIQRKRWAENLFLNTCNVISCRMIIFHLFKLSSLINAVLFLGFSGEEEGVTARR